MEAVLIDTSVLIGRFRREARAMSAMERINGAQLCLCDAIIAEVLAGTRNKTEYAITKRELFEQFLNAALGNLLDSDGDGLRREEQVLRRTVMLALILRS